MQEDKITCRRKIVERCNKLLKTLTDDSERLSNKDARRIIKELFTQILDKEGYTINRDSMRRHGYLDYIASKSTGKSEQTVGLHSIEKKEQLPQKISNISFLDAQLTVLTHSFSYQMHQWIRILKNLTKIFIK